MNNSEQEKQLYEIADGLIKFIKQMVTKIVKSNTLLEFVKAFEGVEILIELGKMNWVVSAPIDREIIKQDKEKIDLYFINEIEKDNGLYSEIKRVILESEFLFSKKKMFLEIFSALEQSNFNISCVALSTMIEYMLAVDTDFNCHKIKSLVDKFSDKNNDIPIDNECVVYLFGLDGFLDNYKRSTSGFEKEKEPIYVNRHWIAHGRMYRELNKVDAYQMLLAIYAYIRLLESRDEEV